MALKEPIGASMSRTINVVVPVYNGEHTIGATVQRVLSLRLSPGWRCELIVVDDGSTDATGSVLAGLHDDRLHVLTLPQQGGRAKACNQGAARADAEYLLFLDADCLPQADEYLASMIGHLQKGADLVYGPIGGAGQGFWADYLLEVERKRRDFALRGDHAMAMTSQHLVRRALFVRAGGYDDDYSHYGFEDVDLIGRLLALNPKVAFEPGCRVAHDAGNTVANYCSKMREAGRYSAPLFAERHPHFYRRKGYGRIDPARSNTMLRPVMKVAGRLLSVPAIRFAEFMVDRAGVPFALQALALKNAAMLSFMRGCAERSAS